MDDSFFSSAFDKYNRAGIPDFENYSPDQMRRIIYESEKGGEFLRLKPLAGSRYADIPLLQQVRYALEYIDKAGELKLTANGYWPVKMVRDIYAQGYIKDPFVDSGSMKLTKEFDSHSIHLAHILIEISGMARKAKGKTRLTRKGQVLLKDPAGLLQEVFFTHADRYNWSYLDRLESEQLGAIGWIFSMILLDKYGKEPRPQSFYAQKYFTAFPTLCDPAMGKSYMSAEELCHRSYLLRTYYWFLELYGLIYIPETSVLERRKQPVSTTDLFHELIEIAAP